jgi:hypothetical protein
MLDQTFLEWKHTKTDFEAHLKWRHEECLPLSADTLKNTREAIRDSRECVRRPMYENPQEDWVNFCRKRFYQSILHNDTPSSFL